MRTMGWEELAACGGMSDPDTFFRDREGVRLCAGCPVSVDCLEGALLRDEHFGVWGGASKYERRRLVKQVGARTARQVAEHFVGVGHARWAA